MPTITRRFASLVVAPLALCALVTASAASAQEKVVLARKAKVGDVSRSSGEMILAINAGGQQLSLNLKETDKATITAVAADGALTVKEELESMEASMNGQVMPPQPAPSAKTAVVRPDGSLVSRSDAAPDSLDGRMYYTTQVLFNDKPVGVGDTWKRDIKADPPQGVPAATAEYKVVAFEKVDGIEAVKISLSYQETATDGVVTTGTFWIDKATGDQVKGEFEFRNVPMPQMGLVSGSGRQARLSGGGASR